MASDRPVAELKVSEYIGLFTVPTQQQFSLVFDAEGFLSEEAEHYVGSKLFPAKVWAYHIDKVTQATTNAGISAVITPQNTPEGDAGPNSNVGNNDRRGRTLVAHFSEPLPGSGNYVLRVFCGNRSYGVDLNVEAKNLLDFSVYVQSTSAVLTWDEPTDEEGRAIPSRFCIRVIPRLSSIRKLLPGRRGPRVEAMSFGYFQQGDCDLVSDFGSGTKATAHSFRVDDLDLSVEYCFQLEWRSVDLDVELTWRPSHVATVEKCTVKSLKEWENELRRQLFSSMEICGTADIGVSAARTAQQKVTQLRPQSAGDERRKLDLMEILSNAGDNSGADTQANDTEVSRHIAAAGAVFSNFCTSAEPGDGGGARLAMEALQAQSERVGDLTQLRALRKVVVYGADHRAGAESAGIERRRHASPTRGVIAIGTILRCRATSNVALESARQDPAQGDQCEVLTPPTIVVKGASYDVVNGTYHRMSETLFENPDNALSVWRDNNDDRHWWIGRRPGCRFYVWMPSESSDDLNLDDKENLVPFPVGQWQLPSRTTSSTDELCSIVREPEDHVCVVNVPPTSTYTAPTTLNIPCNRVVPMRVVAYRTWHSLAAHIIASAPNDRATQLSATSPTDVCGANSPGLPALQSILDDGNLVFGPSDANADRPAQETVVASCWALRVTNWNRVMQLREASPSDMDGFVNLHLRGRWYACVILGVDEADCYNVRIYTSTGNCIMTGVHPITVFSTVQRFRALCQLLPGQFRGRLRRIQNNSGGADGEVSPRRYSANPASAEFSNVWGGTVDCEITRNCKICAVGRGQDEFALADAWVCQSQGTVEDIDYQHCQPKSGAAVASAAIDLHRVATALNELQTVPAGECTEVHLQLFLAMARDYGPTTSLLGLRKCSVLHLLGLVLSFDGIAVIRRRFTCDLFARDGEGHTLLDTIVSGNCAARSALCAAGLVQRGRVGCHEPWVCASILALLRGVEDDMMARLLHHCSGYCVTGRANSQDFQPSAADPSTPASSKRYILHTAAELDLLSTTSLLIALGCDCWILDGQGRTALDAAPARSKTAFFAASSSFRSWRLSRSSHNNVVPNLRLPDSTQSESVLSISHRLNKMRDEVMAAGASESLAEWLLVQSHWQPPAALQMLSYRDSVAGDTQSFHMDTLRTTTGRFIHAGRGPDMLQALRADAGVDDLVNLTKMTLSPRIPSEQDTSEASNWTNALTDVSCMICGFEPDDSDHAEPFSDHDLLRFSWEQCRNNEHWCCASCWRRHLCTEIAAGKLLCHPNEDLRISCACSCSCPATPSSVEQVLAFNPADQACSDALITLKTNTALQYAQESEHLLVCPSSTCKAIFAAPDYTQLSHRMKQRLDCVINGMSALHRRAVTCPSCSEVFCSSCHTFGGHDPLPCAQWKVIHDPPRLLGSELAQEASFINSLTKACPSCHRRVMKESGCLHMTCTRSCGHQWCWACGRPWQGHGGSYFSCRHTRITHHTANRQQDSLTAALRGNSGGDDPFESETQYFRRHWEALSQTAAKTLTHLQSMFASTKPPRHKRLVGWTFRTILVRPGCDDQHPEAVLECMKAGTVVYIHQPLYKVVQLQKAAQEAFPVVRSFCSQLIRDARNSSKSKSEEEMKPLLALMIAFEGIHDRLWLDIPDIGDNRDKVSRESVAVAVGDIVQSCVDLAATSVACGQLQAVDAVARNADAINTQFKKAVSASIVSALAKFFGEWNSLLKDFHSEETSVKGDVLVEEVVTARTAFDTLLESAKFMMCVNRWASLLLQCSSQNLDSLSETFSLARARAASLMEVALESAKAISTTTATICEGSSPRPHSSGTPSAHVQAAARDLPRVAAEATAAVEDLRTCLRRIVGVDQ